MNYYLCYVLEIKNNNEQKNEHVKSSIEHNNSKCLKEKNLKSNKMKYDQIDPEYNIFLQTLRSKMTRKFYNAIMIKFTSFVNNIEKIEKPSDLKLIDSVKFQKYLELYTLQRKEAVEASAVLTEIRIIRSFLEFMEIPYNKKRITKLLPPLNKPHGAKPYTSEQIEYLVSKTTEVIGLMVMICASSGLRRGAVVSLRYGDLIPIDNTYGIIAYHNNPEDPTAEYITFMTNETKVLLDIYTEKRKTTEVLTNNSYIFPDKNDKTKHYADEYFTQRIRHQMKSKLDPVQSKASVRYDIMATHGLRKFFDTAMHAPYVEINQMKIQAINEDVIEQFMGHRSTTQNLKRRYYVKDFEELYNEYKKAIPFLEILTKTRQERKIRELEAKVVVKSEDPPVITNDVARELLERMKKLESQIRLESVKDIDLK